MHIRMCSSEKSQRSLGGGDIGLRRGSFTCKTGRSTVTTADPQNRRSDRTTSRLPKFTYCAHVGHHLKGTRIPFAPGGRVPALFGG